MSIVPGAAEAAAVARQAAESTTQALSTGASSISRQLRDIATGTRESAGLLVRADTGIAIPVDSAGRALIRDDQVVGGRAEAAYATWLSDLRARGVDADRAMVDLGTVWDYLRHDPKWAFDSERNYAGVVMFGSSDSGGAAVLANLVRDRGLERTPAVFSGYAARAPVRSPPKPFGSGRARSE
ncbi:hypothetical protein OHB26_23620 [Nocardia sp. NBC_01503]|uniref:hypothetical protein n=1 Tax=Nocardia sp. NBC_01503 TaxID=2975997 RepID=UPI002E7B6AB3|nr:hypothetical protein [Nocardia sp. NBC_01503]WTL29948.1 hypothetical protein OHB26_23620 [Nocardia sp. NBC_01503]